MGGFWAIGWHNRCHGGVPELWGGSGGAQGDRGVSPLWAPPHLSVVVQTWRWAPRWVPRAARAWSTSTAGGGAGLRPQPSQVLRGHWAPTRHPDFFGAALRGATDLDGNGYPGEHPRASPLGTHPGDTLGTPQAPTPGTHPPGTHPGDAPGTLPLDVSPQGHPDPSMPPHECPMVGDTPPGHVTLGTPRPIHATSWVSHSWGHPAPSVTPHEGPMVGDTPPGHATPWVPRGWGPHPKPDHPTEVAPSPSHPSPPPPPLPWVPHAWCHPSGCVTPWQ